MQATLLQILTRETLETMALVAGSIFEAVGILIIVVAGIGATVVFAREVMQRSSFHDSFEAYRRHLGRGILLGLEFLIAADIIGTVIIEPTIENVGILGLLILVRTFLSIALTVEVEGRWPWTMAQYGTSTERP
jgi:uncharacterized membrane protein